MTVKSKVAVIGAGNGGQAMAGFLAMNGHKVNLYARNLKKIGRLIENEGVFLKGQIAGFGRVERITDDLKLAIAECEVIMIVTTADAHGDVAVKLAPIVEDNQIIVLNPGRTGGAFELRKIFNDICPTKKIYVAEVQSLVYACRIEIPGTVRVFGVKDRVPMATLPSSDLQHVTSVLNRLYNCFFPVENVLITSLENIGAIFHPIIVIFNASRIERGEDFYFYNDITPKVCDVLQKVDKERLELGNAFGIELKSASDWISYAYLDIKGEDLFSKMKNNPAYYQIQAPRQLDSRLLFEDIPTGILPMIELGRLVGLEMPLMNSILHLSESLLDCDFRLTGRTLDRLGLDENEIKKMLKK